MTSPTEQKTTSRRRMRFVLLAAACSVLALAALACNQTNDCHNCQDIVSQIPWGANETHTYVLKSGDSEKGKAVLSLAAAVGPVAVHAVVLRRQGQLRRVRRQGRWHDPEAHHAEPQHHRSASCGTSSTPRTRASSQDECDDSMIVRIKQTTYNPPTADDPSSERQQPALRARSRLRQRLIAVHLAHDQVREGLPRPIPDGADEPPRYRRPSS